MHLIAEGEAVQTKVEQSTQVAGARLEHQTQDGAGKDAQGDAGNGGHLHGHCHDDDHGRQKQDGVYVEHTALRRIQGGGELGHAAHIGTAAMVLHGAEHTKSNQGNGVGDRSGDHHGLYMGHNFGTSHGGGQVGGIRQGGHLIAEVCAGQDGAGGHTGIHAKAKANAHQGHAHGAHGAPGGASSQRGDGADQDAGDEEDGGMHDLQAVVDHGGNDAGIDPHTDQNTHDDQDTNRLEGLIDAVHHHLLNAVPLVAQVQGHNSCHTDAQEHGDMDAGLKDHNADRQYTNQCAKGDTGLPYLRHSGLSIGFIRLTHGFYQPFFHYFAIIAFLIQRWIPGFYLDLCEVHSSSLSFYTLHTVSAVPGARGVGARPGTRERTENVSQFRGAAVRRPARSWPRPGPSPPHRSPPQWRSAGG